MNSPIYSEFIKHADRFVADYMAGARPSGGAHTKVIHDCVWGTVMFYPWELELIDSSPYPLLGIISDGTCVGQYDVGLLYVFSQNVTGILENGKYHLTVVHVHLTSVSLYVYLRL